MQQGSITWVAVMDPKYFSIHGRSQRLRVSHTKWTATGNMCKPETRKSCDKGHPRAQNPCTMRSKEDQNGCSLSLTFAN
uniref:Uncharacterized protein n=1 Tax=Rhizophora mucronata TaxID=61149 RepID=A0A2P2MJ21_RHIMU